MPLRTLRFLLAALCAGLVSTALAATTTLPPEVAAALDRAKLPRDALAVVVQEVGASRSRLAFHGEKPVNPASLMKLVTTAAALDLLGPAWTWTTPVWLDGSVRDGVLVGNLVVKGQGDPKLVLERLWLMLRRVQQLGVREIRGDIVLDRSAFAVPEQDPADFDNEPLRPYNVRPDSLLLNYKALQLTLMPDAARGLARIISEPPLAGVTVDATVPLVDGPCEDWRAALKPDFADAAKLRLAGTYATMCGEKTWSLAYPMPQAYNARALLGLWREMGGQLGGTVRDGVAPSVRPSFELTSPTLAEVVREINKYSNNVMAQQLFLTLGLTQRNLGSPDTARAVVSDWLARRHGALAADSVIDNGSGLSRETRVSTQLLAALLQNQWSGPTMPELMSSLPVSGVDGTMRRSRGPLGRAHLKTGSLRDVAGIAGYVLANSGRRYVLVAIVNHANAAAARPALEALTAWTANDAVGPGGRTDLIN